MKIEEAISELRQNRLMRTDEEIDRFEAALETLTGFGEDELPLDKVYRIFDDATEHEEVMMGLLHAVEEQAGHRSFEQLIAAAADMNLYASNWLRTLTVRILNHGQYRTIYGKALQAAEDRARSETIRLLNRIKEENPGRFGSPVDEVLDIAGMEQHMNMKKTKTASVRKRRLPRGKKGWTIIALAALLTACQPNLDAPLAAASADAPVPSAQTAPQKKASVPAPKPQKAGKNEAALIPSGWHTLKQPNGGLARAQGDLNKDGLSDLALVIQQNGEEGEAMPRRLLLAFGEKGGGYRLSAIADHAVLGADEGGVWGDPFEGVTIERGAVVIRHYGGSSDRWYNTYRFRYQSGDWKWIGYTAGSYFTGTQDMESGDEDDVNLVTGAYTSRRTDRQGHVTKTQGNLGRHPLRSIRDFDIVKEMEKGLFP